MNYNYDYIVNRENVIINVSHNFLFFAQKNDAKELIENSVIGKSLFEFISCKDTRNLYRVLIENAIRELKLFECEYLPGLTHGICHHCKKMMMDEVLKLKRFDSSQDQ
nr:hypothetical protein [uncultured Desulfobacter sp.]